MLTNKRFKSRALRILFVALPRRTKRLVFLASLSGKVAGVKEVDKETCSRLQQKFSMCGDPDAINMPIAFNHAIWGSRPVESLVCPIHLEAQTTEHEVTRTARQIVAMMPCWLVYDTTKVIVQDVRELLTTREEIFQ